LYILTSRDARQFTGWFARGMTASPTGDRGERHARDKTSLGGPL